MSDRRKGYGRGMVVGALMIIAGIAFGVASAAVTGGGCGYAGNCAALPAIYEWIPVMVGVPPVAGGMTLLVLSMYLQGADEDKEAQAVDDRPAHNPAGNNGRPSAG